jgi:thiamine monophosphate kinase
MRLKLATLLIGATAAAGASAHHSFTATYDENAEITIEGTLVQFMFRNPHSFVHVLVPAENGATQRWAVEWGGSGALVNQGVTRDTLKVGDRVVITGNPGRNAVDRRLRMQRLERPADAFSWGTREGETFE